MRLYLVRNRVRQVRYLVYCSRGKDNLAEYFTKHHPTKHHFSIRSTYLLPADDVRKTPVTWYLVTVEGVLKYLPVWGNG